MFGHNHYVPILKWRQSEYQAIWKLEDAVKDVITPLFEIPKENWDFEKQQAAKSIDDHLATFGKRLKAKWGGRTCFVDSCHLPSDACMADGRHHLSHIFELARSERAAPIPVTGLGRSPAYNAAVKQIVASDMKGACIRLQDDDFDDHLSSNLISLLKRIGAAIDDCDLVIDLGANIVSAEKTQAAVWATLLAQVPRINSWRTLTVSGTAFPAALPSSVFRPHGEAPRYDWLAYKTLVEKMDEGERIPAFSDYVTASTNTEMMDPRMMDPTAKIKYTIDGAWFIALGTQVKKNGRGQYVDLCKRIVSHKPRVFKGEPYSWGDLYIGKCAQGLESTGGSSTWPSVAVNHHVTFVSEDVANLFGS